MADQRVLDIVERFWIARSTADKEGVRTVLAADATYEMVGAGNFADVSTVGPAPAASAADRLIDDFQVHGLTPRTSVVGGQMAATIHTLEVSFRSGPRVTTDVCDFWEFDASGKIKSLRQFVDTDLVHRMMNGNA